MTIASEVLTDVTELSESLERATPQAVVAAALDLIGREKLAVVASFGSESAALLKVVADVDPGIPVVFLDTGWLFEETLAYRDLLTQKFALHDVRTIKPDDTDISRDDPERDLWFRDPDSCCHIRKVKPLARLLEGFDGWINGRKRYQGGERGTLPVVEHDGIHLKFNPLANTSFAEIQRMYADFNLPQHPLVASGFTSIGCMPCTSRSAPGEDPRAGRWRGRGKTECGIHIPGIPDRV